MSARVDPLSPAPSSIPAGNAEAGPRGRLEIAPCPEIGRSVEGRPLKAVLAGDESAPLRILVVAGQHGDEAWARDAVRQWLAAMSESVGGGPPGPVHLAAITDANPDGAHRNRRANAQGIDLNRDHLRLSAPETRAIHQFVRAFRPHLVLDIHNYPSRRRQLLAGGWELESDVQLAGPTNPAVQTALSEALTEDLLRSIGSSLESAGHRVSPYLLLRRSGAFRPSTLRTRDLRNVLALRYGIPTLLIEGRDPGRRARTSLDRERTIRAQVAALVAATRWAVARSERLERGPAVPSAGELVPIDAVWTEEGGPAPPLPVRDTRTGRTETLRWPRYFGGLSIRRAVELPRAYAVREDLEGVHELLAEQGFWAEEPAADRHALVEETAPTQTTASDAPRRSPFAAPLALVGYRTYSTHQRGGRALAVWLEGDSRFGLWREGSVAPPRSSPTRPAVVRVRQWDYPPGREGHAGSVTSRSFESPDVRAPVI